MYRVFIALMLVFVSLALKAQDFVKTNPFETNFFIPNQGQFVSPFLEKDDSVYFALENDGQRYFFLKDGFVVLFNDLVRDESKESWIKEIKEKLYGRSGFTEEQFERLKIKSNCIRYRWKNVQNVIPYGIDSSSHYFTYGNNNYYSKGCKKIIYHNFYTNADLVFEIPKHGGIHYSFNCSAGFDHSQISWSLDNLDTIVFSSQKMQFISQLDTLVEYGLNVVQGGIAIPSKYNFDGHYFSFDIAYNLKSNIGFVIDPFVLSISNLRSGGPGNSKATDVDYDFASNLYVFGGGSASFLNPQNQRIAKYSSNGTHRWTFMGNVPSINWDSKGTNGAFGNFIVDKRNGKIYVGQGFENNIGTRIIRLDSNGIYNNYVSQANINFSELWDMAIDCKNNSVFGMGGSTYSNQNSAILDSLGNYSNFNFTGVALGTYPFGLSQDVVTTCLDDDKNLFVIVASNSTNLVNNQVYRLNKLYTQSIWNNALTNSSFNESNNKPFIGPFASNGFNGMNVNDYYVFTYDGSNIEAFDKNTGANVGSFVTIPGYQMLNQGGIVADHCNRVYVGGNNGAVNVLSFNGTNFVSLPDINLSGVLGRKIYDIKINREAGKLFICGDSFVSITNIPYVCTTGGIQLTSKMLCPNLGIVNISNFDSSAVYSFYWRDSTTHTSLKFSKNLFKSSDTLVGIIPNHLYSITVYSNINCSGPFKTIAFGGNKFLANQSFEICNGNSITVGNHTYSNSGVYVDTIYQGSCVTYLTTKLTVRPRYDIYRTYAICAGNAVHIGSHFYYSTGNYLDSLISYYGCDSIIHSHIIVGNSSSLIQNLVGCQGYPLIVGNKTYYNNGVFIDTLYNYVFCDSVVTTTMQFYPKTFYTQHLTTCYNHPIYVGNTAHSSPGVFVDYLKNRFGCDSIVTTYLAVVPYKSSGNSYNVCQGTPVVVGNHIYNSIGFFIDTLNSYLGCDSIVFSQISWKNIQYTNQSISTCSNNPLIVGNHIHTSSGFYIDTLISSNSCDSIVFSLLSVSTSQTITKNYHSCIPLTITVGNHSYSTTGVYRDTFTNIYQCDSIIITNLVIGTAKSKSQTIYLCNASVPIAVANHFYNLPGTYYDTIQTYLGCDSFITTTILNGIRHVRWKNIALCAGDKFNVGTHSYTTAGTFHDTLINIYGCDSFVNSIITIIPSSFLQQTLTICANKSIKIGNQIHNASGVYFDTLVNFRGCDSIVKTTLYIKPVSSFFQNIILCQGLFIQVGSKKHSLPGTYKDTLINYWGCDSVVTTVLTIKNRSFKVLNLNICSGDYVQIATHQYVNSGTYFDTLLNYNGCDSIIKTILTVHNVTLKQNSVTICSGQTYSIGTHTYNLAGIYWDTIKTVYNCDSIVKTILSVGTNSIKNQTVSICNGNSIQVGIHNYSVSGTYYDHLVNYVGCDSSVTTVLQVKPSYKRNNFFTVCAGDTLNLNGQLIIKTGVYIDSFSSVLGCDSVIINNVNVLAPIIKFASYTFCKGDTLLINGQTFPGQGLFTDTFVSWNGCDSVQMTNIQINSSYLESNKVLLCDGQTYLFNGHNYSVSGIYYDTLSTFKLCDSIIKTILQVDHIYRDSLNYTICTGDSLVLGSFIHKVQGLYFDTIKRIGSCDSILIVNLNISTSVVELSVKPDTVFFAGDKLTLKATPNLSTDSIINWYPLELISNVNDWEQSIKPTQSTWLNVITLNEFGCKASDSLHITLISLVTPNVFTPNGDGQNDKFYVYGNGEVAIKKIMIYNRWGEKVFECSDSNIGWDGTYMGSPQPMDTYSYQVIIDHKGHFFDKTINGSFTLLR